MSGSLSTLHIDEVDLQILGGPKRTQGCDENKESESH